MSAVDFADDPIAVIEGGFARQVAFLADLVRAPSDNPPGDTAPHAEITAELLQGLGFEVELHAPPSDLVQCHGLVSAVNLVVRHRFGAGPTVALNAHGDVVAPGAGWSVDPYGAVVRDGWMYGRGVAVSKSDIATYAFALRALIDSRAVRHGAVELHVTYDEETGGDVGPKWLLEQGVSNPDYAICAGFTHNVCVAHNGCLHLEVHVKGLSAHAAFPDSGVDALEACTGLLKALYDLRETYKTRTSSVPGIGHPTLVVGLISGGINTNVVPDAVTLRLDRRILPDEEPNEVERELVEHIRKAGGAYGSITIEVERILLAHPLTPGPGSERLLGSIRSAARRVLAEEPSAEGVPIYTDARHYAAHGVPTVLYGAGPKVVLDANAHRADERLRLDDLMAATKIVALALEDLLNQDGENRSATDLPSGSR